MFISHQKSYWWWLQERGSEIENNSVVTRLSIIMNICRLLIVMNKYRLWLNVGHEFKKGSFYGTDNNFAKW